MNVGKSAKGVELSANLHVRSEVPDIDLAADLMDEVIGGRGVREPVKSMLERAYSTLSKRNSAWTRRRVRAVFNKEANRIDYREIKEMRSVIEERMRHAAYREETARIASMALVREAPEDCSRAP